MFYVLYREHTTTACTGSSEFTKLRNTGILNKIKLFLPSRILKTIYSSLILFQLNYGILVWGQNYKRIFKLQKRVMRIITCSKYNAHSEPLFKELKLLKLEDIRKLSDVFDLV